jgi:HEPN domain-containing protein
MNPLALEWVQKAEGDYAVTQWLAQAAVPVHDAICFHAQQCIEKYLKAWLQEANIAFRRTHDLEELLDMILPIEPAWAVWKPEFLVLTTHAVDFRYPGRSAASGDAQHATLICSQVRQAVRVSLGLLP